MSYPNDWLEKHDITPSREEKPASKAMMIAEVLASVAVLVAGIAWLGEWWL